MEIEMLIRYAHEIRNWNCILVATSSESDHLNSVNWKTKYVLVCVFVFRLYRLNWFYLFSHQHTAIRTSIFFRFPISLIQSIWKSNCLFLIYDHSTTHAHTVTLIDWLINWIKFSLDFPLPQRINTPLTFHTSQSYLISMSIKTPPATDGLCCMWVREWMNEWQTQKNTEKL